MITIKNNRGEFLNVGTLLFPAGEVGVKLAASNIKFFYNDHEVHPALTSFTFIARLHDPKNIWELYLIKDAFERLALKYKRQHIPINLVLPFCPYARQDRVCVDGEAFSLKAFGNFINGMNFNKVTVFDPHSDVLQGVFNNIQIVSQLDIVIHDTKFRNRVLRGGVFLSPDAGSNKKTSEIAKFFEHKEFIRADKLRNLETGKIKETIVYCDDLRGQDVFISDDICVYGGTFVEVAKKLREKNCGKIILRVTHGEFPAGEKTINSLLEVIDEIYVSNSYTASWVGYMPHIEDDRFNVLELERAFAI